MLTRRQKQERLEDEYLSQMRDFRRVAESYEELRFNSRRFTETLGEQLRYQLREAPYEVVHPHLSEIYQIGENFQRQVHFYQDQLEEERLSYLKQYRYEMEELERYHEEE